MKKYLTAISSDINAVKNMRPLSSIEMKNESMKGTTEDVPIRKIDRKAEVANIIVGAMRLLMNELRAE